MAYNGPEYYRVKIGSEDADPYRVLLAYGITHPCQQHAIKKLLRAGRHNAPKPLRQDVEEVIETLGRWLDIMDAET